VLFVSCCPRGLFCFGGASCSMRLAVLSAYSGKAIWWKNADLPPQWQYVICVLNTAIVLQCRRKKMFWTTLLRY